MMTQVSVDYYDGTTREVKILYRCNTIKEAEDWIAEREKVDPDNVHAGHYGINAPEEMTNPTIG
jgi:hypothetical protein